MITLRSRFKHLVPALSGSKDLRGGVLQESGVRLVGIPKRAEVADVGKVEKRGGLGALETFVGELAVGTVVVALGPEKKPVNVAMG